MLCVATVKPAPSLPAHGWRWLLSLGLVWLMLLPQASQSGDTEAGLRAAFIYNFAKFVTWPPATFAKPETPLEIGLVGDDALMPALQLLEGKLLDGRAMRVRRLTAKDDPASCHLLYFSNVPELARQQTLAKLGTRPVLTVGDDPTFIAGGGMIYLYRESDALRFTIHHRQATDRGLTVSARLLAVARIVPAGP